MHRILCIPRKLLETCRLRVRFCPAGIGRRLQRGGKQQKRRLAKSLTGHDCRDRHNSIGADYAESVHNSGLISLLIRVSSGLGAGRMKVSRTCASFSTQAAFGIWVTRTRRVAAPSRGRHIRPLRATGVRTWMAWALLRVLRPASRYSKEQLNHLSRFSDAARQLRFRPAREGPRPPPINRRRLIRNKQSLGGHKLGFYDAGTGRVAGMPVVVRT